MEEVKNSVEKLVDDTTDLIHSYRDLAVIRIVEYGSQGISMGIMGILSLFVAGFVLLFTGLGSAWWLGEYLKNMKAGFFIMGGLYTIIFIALLLTLKRIWLPRVRNFIIKKIYDQN
ncbi:MAG TPA: phage holin family protein [Cyclobacteriaceae bacterium]